jgi:phospholipase C
MTDRERHEAEARFREEHPEAHMRRREFLARTAGLAGLAGLATVLPAETLISEAAKVQTRAHLPSPRNIPIDTFVVLMMENRSFDHYFNWFPGADGKARGLRYPDDKGRLHRTHPLPPDFQGCGFNDPDHSWVGGRIQYHHGKLDGFRRGDNDAYAIGYYEKTQAADLDDPSNAKGPAFVQEAAKAFTLYDRYFCSLLGPTFSNRYYQWAAQSGGQVHNNIPPKPDFTGAEFESIFDRAIAHGLTARYYHSDQPFGLLFGSRSIPWLRTIAQFYDDAAAGTLPSIAFVDPPFLDGGGGDGLSGDEHPHGDIRIGQAFMSDITHAFLESPQFRSGVMFINYDEWGGFFDHVSPRMVPDDRQHRLPIDATDRDKAVVPPYFGITGFRIPGVAVSPYVKRRHVSHATVTHESILKLIAYRFGLGYLNMRHRYASNVGRTLDWQNPSFDIPDLPSPPPPATVSCSAQGKRAWAETPGERREGAGLGSPEWYRYVESLGYEIQAPTADRIFRDPGRLDPAFRELWDRKARQVGTGS